MGEFDAQLKALGLEPTSTRDGVTYKRGANVFCRIDPKPSIDSLRVFVGADAEGAAPSTLRGQYKQKGWLVVRPEDGEIALTYVLGCVRSALGLN
jgi:hypothetical protein